jgi:hypothetical protein
LLRSGTQSPWSMESWSRHRLREREKGFWLSIFRPCLSTSVMTLRFAYVASIGIIGSKPLFSLHCQLHRPFLCAATGEPHSSTACSRKLFQTAGSKNNWSSLSVQVWISYHPPLRSNFNVKTILEALSLRFLIWDRPPKHFSVVCRYSCYSFFCDKFYKISMSSWTWLEG